MCDTRYSHVTIARNQTSLSLSLSLSLYLSLYLPLSLSLSPSPRLDVEYQLCVYVGESERSVCQKQRNRAHMCAGMCERVYEFVACARVCVSTHVRVCGL